MNMKRLSKIWIFNFRETGSIVTIFRRDYPTALMKLGVAPARSVSVNEIWPGRAMWVAPSLEAEILAHEQTEIYSDAAESMAVVYSWK